MLRDQYLEQLARDGRRMADLGRGDLAVPVPTCPDWTLGDLLLHTGQVHRWQTEAAREDHGEFPGEGSHSRQPANGQSLPDWFQEGVDLAVATMSTIDASATRWTWFPPDQTAGWYFRRITQETLVHRIDAELTASDVTGVDPVLAADGIAEMCEVFIPSADGQPIGGGGQSLHLHATDADSEWLLTLHGDRVDVQRGHAKGDAAVRGTARDLLLLVWGREPLDPIEVLGDGSVVATFRAAAKI